MHLVFFSHLELEAIHKSFKVQAHYEKKNTLNWNQDWT